MIQEENFIGLSESFEKLSKVSEETLKCIQSAMEIITSSMTEDRTRYTERQWRIRQRFIKARMYRTRHAIYPHQFGIVYKNQRKRSIQFKNVNSYGVNGYHTRKHARQRSKLKSSKFYKKGGDKDGK